MIGAGLSGLNAALLLEEQGLRVRVFEGRKRVGGRMFTLDALPGKPEGSGNLIGPRYARALDLVGRFKVRLAPARPRTEPVRGEVMLNVRVQNVRLEDWARSPLNRYPIDCASWRRGRSTSRHCRSSTRCAISATGASPHLPATTCRYSRCPSARAMISRSSG